MEHFDVQDQDGRTPHHISAQQRVVRAQKVHDIMTREMLEQAVRDNHQMLDETEPGNYFGAFPFGYRPCNTLR